MHEFVKLHDTRTNLKYPWILKCSDPETLITHTEKYMSTEIGKGILDFFQRHEMHANTNWRGAVETLGKMRGGISFVEQSLTLENDVFNGKLRVLTEYGVIYLRSNGSYMTSNDNTVVLESLHRENMVYPEYDSKDIRVIQWPNGTHHYAKLGNMDVVDPDGNQKWDTYDEAYEAALNYL